MAEWGAQHALAHWSEQNKQDHAVSEPDYMPFKIRTQHYVTKGHPTKGKKAASSAPAFTLRDVLIVPEEAKVDHIMEGRFVPAASGETSIVVVFATQVDHTCAQHIVMIFDRNTAADASVDPRDLEAWKALHAKAMEPGTQLCAERLKILPFLAEGGGWLMGKAVNNQAGQLAMALETRQFEGPGYVEVDIDVEGFKSQSIFTKLAASAVGLVKPQVTKLAIDLAFMYCGYCEEELPERLIGCVRLHHIHLNARVEDKAKEKGEAPAAAPPPEVSLKMSDHAAALATITMRLEHDKEEQKLHDLMPTYESARSTSAVIEAALLASIFSTCGQAKEAALRTGYLLVVAPSTRRGSILAALNSKKKRFFVLAKTQLVWFGSDADDAPPIGATMLASTAEMTRGFTSLIIKAEGSPSLHLEGLKMHNDEIGEWVTAIAAQIEEQTGAPAVVNEQLRYKKSGVQRQFQRFGHWMANDHPDYEASALKAELVAPKAEEDRPTTFFPGTSLTGSSEPPPAKPPSTVHFAPPAVVAPPAPSAPGPGFCTALTQCFAPAAPKARPSERSLDAARLADLKSKYASNVH